MKLTKFSQMIIFNHSHFINTEISQELTAASCTRENYDK